MLCFTWGSALPRWWNRKRLFPLWWFPDGACPHPIVSVAAAAQSERRTASRGKMGVPEKERQQSCCVNSSAYAHENKRSMDSGDLLTTAVRMTLINFAQILLGGDKYTYWPKIILKATMSTLLHICPTTIPGVPHFKPFHYTDSCFGVTAKFETSAQNDTKWHWLLSGQTHSICIGLELPSFIFQSVSLYD